jgi:hypothetical protein
MSLSEYLDAGKNGDNDPASRGKQQLAARLPNRPVAERARDPHAEL